MKKEKAGWRGSSMLAALDLETLASTWREALGHGTTTSAPGTGVSSSTRTVRRRSVTRRSNGSDVCTGTTKRSSSIRPLGLQHSVDRAPAVPRHHRTVGPEYL